MRFWVCSEVGQSQTRRGGGKKAEQKPQFLWQQFFFNLLYILRFHARFWLRYRYTIETVWSLNSWYTKYYTERFILWSWWKKTSLSSPNTQANFWGIKAKHIKTYWKIILAFLDPFQQSALTALSKDICRTALGREQICLFSRIIKPVSVPSWR